MDNMVSHTIQTTYLVCHTDLLLSSLMPLAVRDIDVNLLFH